MAQQSISLSFDTRRFRQQLHQLMALVEHLPRRKAQKYLRKAQRLCAYQLKLEPTNRRRAHACGAPGNAYRVHVEGFDALLGAAMLAARPTWRF